VLETYLKKHWSELSELEFEVPLYNLTNTFFRRPSQSKSVGSTRQFPRPASTSAHICIGLVFSRCGMPLSHEVFAGNTADVTTDPTPCWGNGFAN
jgi:hypothetical protein